MVAKTKRILKLTLGWIFVVLGIAGLVLPFLQGILFLAIGFSLIASESIWAKRLIVRFRQRYPESYGKVEAVRLQARAWLGRFRKH